MKLHTVPEHFSSARIAFQEAILEAFPPADIQLTHCGVNVWSGSVSKQQSTLKTNDPSAFDEGSPGTAGGIKPRLDSLNLKTWELLCIFCLAANYEDPSKLYTKGAEILKMQ